MNDRDRIDDQARAFETSQWMRRTMDGVAGLPQEAAKAPVMESESAEGKPEDPREDAADSIEFRIRESLEHSDYGPEPNSIDSEFPENGDLKVILTYTKGRWENAMNW